MSQYFKYPLVPVQTWVDSDGTVAYNGPRGAGLSDPRGNPAGALDSASFLTDGQWHMLSVTTQTNATKGFRCAAQAACRVLTSCTFLCRPDVGEGEQVSDCGSAACMRETHEAMPGSLCMQAFLGCVL